MKEWGANFDSSKEQNKFYRGSWLISINQWDLLGFQILQVAIEV